MTVQPPFEFTAPAQGESWDKQASLGHLLVIDVVKQGPAEQTTYGVAEPIIATVHDVDAQTTIEEVKIFTGSLIGALKPRISSKVLAVLTQGAAQPGKNPPYLLDDRSTDAQAAQRAAQYLKAWQAGQVHALAASQPAQQPAAAGNGLNLDDPAVQAALAALAKQQAGQPSF